MRKEKITKIQLEDKRLCRGPRKPKGGGYHGDKRKGKKANTKLNKDNWQDLED